MTTNAAPTRLLVLVRHAVLRAGGSLGGLALLAGAACAPHEGTVAHAQEAAQELNQDARFGRTELAIDHVAAAARADFASHHQAWGSAIRVADLELTGTHAHGEKDVDILIRVAWYRPDELDLRTTTLQQHWRNSGSWQLTDEQRVDGDIGLIGERVVVVAPDQPRTPSQFPTIRLRGEDKDE